MTEQKIDTGTRLGSMVLDHVFMTMISMVFFLPGMILNFATAFKVTHEQTSPDIFGGMSYLGLLGFAIYFCKDCINGQSIAKRILKLQVVNNATGQVASPLRCFVRNIFCILWPIEVFVAIGNTSRRLGDRVAGTKLILFDPTIEQPKLKFGQIAIALALACGIMILIMLPFRSMQSKLGEQKINFVESSYNEQESKATEKLFAHSLGKNLSADVRVYDKIQNENLKYVSIIFRLKENYLEDDDNFEQVKSATVPLLLTMFPEKTFVGQLKYVFEEPGHMQMRTMPLDWRTKSK
ncbi:MAG TPA: RDD family protein [Chitinophagales bacterium]|nr:RDD family protein [Chitinophagales bacterium]